MGTRFRQVLLDVSNDLSDVDRKKLAFLLGSDVERRLRDNATIEGTLDIFQQLFDRGKISNENFSYLIDAFRGIKCDEIANRLEALQMHSMEISLLPLGYNELTFEIPPEPSAACTTTPCNNHRLNHLVDELLEDPVVIEDSSRVANTHPLPDAKLVAQVSTVTPPIKEGERDHNLCHPRKNAYMLLLISTLILMVIGTSLALLLLRKPIKSDGFTITVAETSTHGNENDEACLLPRNQSCTAHTPSQTTAAGLGVFYQYPCDGVGCNFQRPFCRLCAKHPSKIDNPYPKCPACVPDLSFS